MCVVGCVLYRLHLFHDDMQYMTTMHGWYCNFGAGARTPTTCVQVCVNCCCACDMCAGSRVIASIASLARASAASLVQDPHVPFLSLFFCALPDEVDASHLIEALVDIWLLELSRVPAERQCG